MRGLRVLGVGVLVLIGLIGAVPVASAAPPDDRVLVIEFSDTVDCDGGVSVTFDATGWANGPFDASHPTNYHVKWVFSNADGQSWTWNDTGNITFFERDGVLYSSLSGRAIAVGPDGTGWIGHSVINTETNDVSYVGHGLGDIFELACSMLT
jgi:hypothetical protein